MADGGWNGPDDEGTATPPEGGSAGRWQAAPGAEPFGGFSSGKAGESPQTTEDWARAFRSAPAETSDAADTPICQFLRSINPDGSLGDAQSVAVSNHRCAAFGDPLPLSLRQQELVCLQRVHVSCPRYLRGTVLANEAALSGPPEEERSRPGLIALAALALVIVAIAILVTGPILGILPFGGAGGSATPIIVVVSPSAEATGSAEATVTPAPTATASVAATASPVATPTPTPTPFSSPTWPPGATASRMNLLTPCPDGQNCYVYVVRGPGQNGSTVTDTLAGIARYFGVSVDSIVALNPGLTSNSVLTAGQELKIPPPTR